MGEHIGLIPHLPGTRGQDFVEYARIRCKIA